MAKETMTENEAIKQLEFDKKMICFDSTHGEDIPLERVSEQNRLTYEADCVAIKALEEVQQYRSSGTPEECRAAVNKPDPKKPIYAGFLRGGYWCLYCNEIVRRSDCYCSNCGQKLDWGNDNE